MKNEIINDLKMHHSVQFEKRCMPLCVKRDPDEEGVFHSGKLFLCLIEDERFPDRWALRKLQPYIAFLNEPDKPDYGFGWISAEGQYVAHNKHQPVVDWWDEKIIAFKEIE